MPQIYEHRFVIADIDGTALAELPVSNPTWTFSLNAPGSCSFALPIRHPQVTPDILSSGDRDLYIYRDNVLRWAGRIWGIDASSNDDNLRCRGEGWLSILNRRLITDTQNFNADDQLDIAWDLIDYTQTKVNGDIGITRGSLTPSGVTRDRNYPSWERPNIGRELVAMTELADGFDFYISPDKVWHTYFPMKGEVKTIPLELGKNVASIAIQEDSQGLTNSFSAIGGGEGQATCIAVANDLTSQANYGLLENSESFSTIRNFATLQDRADSRLSRLAKPRRQPNIYAVLGDDQDEYDYVIGDRVTLKADYGWLTVDDPARIITMTYQLTNEGREAITIGFDGELTAA